MKKARPTKKFDEMTRGGSIVTFLAILLEVIYFNDRSG